MRTRFSPSPTGYFHVGGGRSVLDDSHFIFDNANPGFIVYSIPEPTSLALIAASAALTIALVSYVQ